MKRRAVWLALILVLVAAPPALAAAPAFGIVVEGTSVPGLALGDERAVAEASYGAPSDCQPLPYHDGRQGLDGICRFPVDEGGEVTVYFRAPDGGPSEASPSDVVFHIRWDEPVSGWTTTAGVNTTLALADPDAVITAYPNAEVVTNPLSGNVESIEDAALGILVDYHFQYLTGQTSVTMSISFPRTPEPPPEQVIRVHDVDLSATKTKGQRRVNAAVGVRDHFELGAEGATVTATWQLPDGSTQSVDGTTSSSGYVVFALRDVRRGQYTFTVDDVTLDGYRFDRDNSVLSAGIRVR